MSVASEITRLQNAKSALATSIGNKGVTVPASTTLDGYSALVDQIQTGGGGGTADDGVWHRPSNWPDYTKIPMSGIGTSEVYLTYDCRYAKAGMEPKAIALKAYATGGYDVERGYIDNSGFVAVTQQHITSSDVFFEYLPTDEGDFVVYRVTAENDIVNFGLDPKNSYIGDQRLYEANQPVVEMYGKLDDSASCNMGGNGTIVSFAVSLKSVTNFKNFFINGYSLEYVDASLIDTSSATTFEGMFNLCTSLKHIDVSDWDTGEVTTFRSMFNSCYNLREIDVSDWDTSKLTDAYYMFRMCYKLTCEIDLSGWDMSLVTNTTAMFGSANVPAIHMPSDLTVVSASTFDSTRWCTVYIFDSVTPPTSANKNMFNNFNTSAKIYVPDNSVNDYKTASNWSNWASYIYRISDLT